MNLMNAPLVAVRNLVNAGARGTVALSLAAARTGFNVGVRATTPSVDSVPEGRWLELPDRGRAFVVDVPGPSPSAPTVLLLHGLAATAYLNWYPALEELSRTYRVIALDLRWHGRGIAAERFRIADCSDDAVAVLDELGVERAVVAGYSMGGAVAQMLWRQHPDRVAGLLLCSTAARWAVHRGERIFFPMLGALSHPLARIAGPRVLQAAAELEDTLAHDGRDLAAWGRDEFKGVSLWSLPEVLAELGRFDSSKWLGEIDVPTAVVVTATDRMIAPSRQLLMARAIPGVSIHIAPGGHTSFLFGHADWFPTFRDALEGVVARASSATAA